MKAFIHKIVNGKERPGTLTNFVTNEYKNLDNLIKFSLKERVGTFHIEAYHDWGNRYKDADIDIIIEKEEPV